MLRSFAINKLKKFGINQLGARAFTVSTCSRNLEEEWKKLAQVQLKGKAPDSLWSSTPEV
jgi:hypothetical protein